MKTSLENNKNPKKQSKKQSRIEQRKQDCENTQNALEEFKSQAIYY